MCRDETAGWPAMTLHAGGFRSLVFKNRGALLVPVAIVLFVFGRPTAESAAIGIIVALLGEMLRIWAVGYSGVTTRANVVVAPLLVTAGPYAFVRNPLYLANAVIALGFWGAFSGRVSITASMFMLCVTLLLVIGVYAVIVPLEEAYLTGHFGDEYRRYAAAVPRTIPSGRALPFDQRRGTWRPEVIGRAEIITLAFFALMVFVALMKIGPWSGVGIYR
jgi:protein-S-isoprenylcysteine O-methyltransferase Ste14